MRIPLLPLTTLPWMTTQQSFVDAWSETSDGEKSGFSAPSAIDRPGALFDQLFVMGSGAGRDINGLEWKKTALG